MTAPNEAATATGPGHGWGLDRPMLSSNLASGALWLLLPAAFGAWSLMVLGAAYVVIASVFLARVYAGGALTMRQEALAWITPWLVAVALWAMVAIGTELESASHTASSYLFALYAGLVIATPCYVGWQMLALAIRQFLAWRTRPSASRAGELG